MTKLEVFDDFHSRNTKVYAEFARLTREQIKRGTKWPISAKNLIQKIRRNKKIRTTTMREGKPKIDNNHIAFYARLFMERHPGYHGIFAVRKMKDVPGAVDRIGSTQDYDHY